MPERIQRKRSKGWRMPVGAKYVGRPTYFGNPFVVGSRWMRNGEPVTLDAATAVEFYRQWLTSPPMPSTRFAHLHHLVRTRLQLGELRGHDLACWCPLEDEHGNRVPCHADVLLSIAAGGDGLCLPHSI